ncbi:sensor domain-containing protein [Amycolatopsis sp. CA-230715]|uniref:sensor domain-containing protein n=1 Tax=Amycolatopsis sp. CA-230715 TaxID=2745196 RepID=UPI001C009BE6|nr:sensor domain-containing protein [Amycolatopsis sp. CA-230715]QWF79021.1 hypothetical protein HUW46_02423 [Amycolatopsis sp. CA-230715]
MTSTTAVAARRRTTPSLGGSMAYLLLNFPLGVMSFVFIVALTSAGLGTAIVWIGLPILALMVLTIRGWGRAERARIYAMLDVAIPMPYRPLPPDTQRGRWKTRLSDVTTWRDLAYFFLLFPLGIFEFVLVVTFWATSLGLIALPIYFRYLPDGAYFFPAYNVRWFTVDSTLSALPWAALGVLCAALSIALTKGLAGMHVRFAKSLLGPTVTE